MYFVYDWCCFWWILCLLMFQLKMLIAKLIVCLNKSINHFKLNNNETNETKLQLYKDWTQ